MSDKDIINQIKNLEGLSLEKATEKFNTFSSSDAAQKYVDILSEDPEGKKFENPDKISSLVYRAVEAGSSLTDVASVLKIKEEDARKLLGVSPSVIKQGPDIPYGREFDEPSRPLTIDQPDVTLTELMSKSRPSVPSVNVPSAGSAQGYNPYAQN